MLNLNVCDFFIVLVILVTSSEIIYLSFLYGNFPNCLKRAIVIPVHKSGDSALVSNYRPISLLSPISMLFEKCFYVWFTNFLSKPTILSDTKYGSRQGSATQDVIIKLTEFVYEAIIDRKLSGDFFIGYSKAFDTMNHRRLLQELDRYGIRGVTSELMADYFYNR